MNPTIPMKHLRFLALFSAATTAALAQPIDVPLPETITVEKPVVVLQSVSVSSVQISRILIDTSTRQISFQLTGGNQTVTLDGAAYDAIAVSFTNQFAQSIAPLIEARLRSEGAPGGQ